LRYSTVQASYPQLYIATTDFRGYQRLISFTTKLLTSGSEQGHWHFIVVTQTVA